ncbi:MAG: S9 family peptidase [Verrucomicrobia bacterium]|nr:S9 family peptidase [Verrucomicrobiota bacterium]
MKSYFPPRPAWHHVVCLACLLPVAGFAKDASTNTPPPGPWLTMDRIFSSTDFAEDPAPSLRWAREGRSYLTLEPDKSPEAKGGSSLVSVDAAAGMKEVLVEARLWIPPGDDRALPLHGFQFSADQSKILVYTHSQRVWRHNSRGDYWVLDRASGRLDRLGGMAPPGSLMFAKFSPDSTQVAYAWSNAIWVQRLSDLRTTLLTPDASPHLIHGSFDWVYEEELMLLDGFEWSPDGRRIAFWQTDTSGVREHTMIRNTDELYPVPVRWPYPKAGQRNSSVQIGAVDVETPGRIRWMNIPGDPRENYLARMQWASNSTELLIQQFNRLQNTNRVFLANADSGKADERLVEWDAAWLENDNAATLLTGGREFLWLSDRSGWQHLYRAQLDDGRLEAITSGEWDVVSIAALDQPRGWVYFMASPEDPTQRYLYRARLAGGGLERLTPIDQPGTHQYQVSPCGDWAIHTWSAFDRPPVTDLVRLPSHESVRMLRENRKLHQAWAALKQPKSELFRVEITDGVELDAWILHPPRSRSARRNPALFHVYGEPHGQSVADAWKGRTHLWHCYLAQQGCVVISVDNRGAYAPRGRAWRKAGHLKLGILTPADQAAAARVLLKSKRGLDPERLAIWGWSGGGTLSLNSTFQNPGLYRTAIAVAAVPDLRYYDTIYQERYMGLPQSQPEAYRLGSALTHASKLKGDLLLIHGTGDDNVHYQGMEALINELVAHGKQFSMMSYPDRGHGISEGRGTSRHLYELMTRHLRDKLELRR